MRQLRDGLQVAKLAKAVPELRVLFNPVAEFIQNPAGAVGLAVSNSIRSLVL